MVWPDFLPVCFALELPMLSRALLAGVICLVMQVSLQAEPTVFLRGKRLTYRHFVYGEVSSSAQRAGTINLGYAHGLQLGQEVGVLRRSEGKLLPIGVLRLVKVRPSESFGEYEGEFHLQREDMVIVSARDLNLWQGSSRSDQMVIKSLLSRSGKGYDTGDVTPAILNEVGRDDDLSAKKPPVLHVNADAYSMQSPQTHITVNRGAFRPASSDEDGAANMLSLEDRRLSPDQSTLDLETALSRFVSTNAAGKVDVDLGSLQMLASDRSGLVDPEEVRADLEDANARIRNLIRPK